MCDSYKKFYTTNMSMEQIEKILYAAVEAIAEQYGFDADEAFEFMRWEAGDVCVPINMLAWLAKIYECPMQGFLDGVRPR